MSFEQNVQCLKLMHKFQYDDVLYKLTIRSDYYISYYDFIYMFTLSSLYNGDYQIQDFFLKDYQYMKLKTQEDIVKLLNYQFDNLSIIDSNSKITRYDPSLYFYGDNIYRPMNFSGFKKMSYEKVVELVTECPDVIFSKPLIVAVPSIEKMQQALDQPALGLTDSDPIVRNFTEKMNHDYLLKLKNKKLFKELILNSKDESLNE